MNNLPLIFNHKLDPFFNPRSIAIVGASERGMYPAGLLRNLLEYDFPGEIFPVNPSRETVFSLRCYQKLGQLPAVPDLVIIIVPRRFVLPTLHQCIDLGVPAALVITAGFAEADDKGKELQAEIAQLLQNRDLTLIGPNCAGLANIPGRVIATRLTTPPNPGPISFVSQSGALMMALYGLFADRQLGLNKLISLGNQVDVTLADGLAYLAQDEETAVIGAFVEGIQDGRRFAKALEAALRAGKPLVLVKSGRTAAGQAAAKTHTAALAGSDRVFSAVCKQFGVIQAADLDEMIDTMQLLATFGASLSSAGRAAVVTQSGGMGSLTADLCHQAGLSLPPISDVLQAQLRVLPQAPKDVVFGNPADVRGAAVIGEATVDTLTPFMADPDTDIVILLLAKSTLRDGEDATARAILQVYQEAQKPLLVVWVGQRKNNEQEQVQPATDVLVEAGVPLFASPGRAIKSLAHAVNYRRFHANWLADPEMNQNG